MIILKPAITATTTLCLVAGLSACSPIDVAANVSVTITDTSCELSQTVIPAGVATFTIENSRQTLGEFYVFKADGKSVAAEVENIGAGLTRKLTAELSAGKYVFACLQTDGETGMRGNLRVTTSKANVAVSVEAAASINAYKAFVNRQADELLSGTENFAAAVVAKDVAGAKALYASTRAAWERIEPVAESFGDLDPKMDAREGDLDPATPWTGWHALEKQLWITGLDSTSSDLANQLVADTKDLVARISSVDLTLSQISNGAKELMDEVATGKVTGEEERYSRTDLWDFEANVAGAMKVVEVSSAILETKDADLLREINTAFAALNAELEKHRVGSGFKLYSALTPAEIKRLAALVEATSEPLSHMTAALVK